VISASCFCNSLICADTSASVMALGDLLAVLVEFLLDALVDVLVGVLRVIGGGSHFWQ